MTDTIQIIATGGTFDKRCDEIEGYLTFKSSHLPGIIKIVHCTLSGEKSSMLRSVRMTRFSMESAEKDTMWEPTLHGQLWNFTGGGKVRSSSILMMIRSSPPFVVLE